MSRCLYNSSFEKLINSDENSIFGALCDNYHGDALTTTREAWKEEISIIKGVLSNYADKNGEVIFEYDIPRLGKRIDVVLLYRGIIFCVEFKVGESKILEGDIDQVLDYALDLKNFHKFSENNLIVPILVATNYRNSSTDIRMSVYDDRVVNPLVTGEAGISNLISKILEKYPNEPEVNLDWIISPYALNTSKADATTLNYAVGKLREAKSMVQYDKDIANECDLWIGEALYKQGKYSQAATSYKSYIRGSKSLRRSRKRS